MVRRELCTGSGRFGRIIAIVARLINKLNGLAWQRGVASSLNSLNNGYTFVLGGGKGSGVKTPHGYRHPDIRVYDSGGNLIAYLETKLGKSVYHATQMLKDQWILKNLKIPTIIIRPS